MGCFYTINKAYNSPFFIISPYITKFPWWKWLLFYIQEFGLFWVLGYFFRPEKTYFGLLLICIPLTLLGSRDLIMSGSITIILMLLYFLSEKWQISKYKYIATALIITAIPNQFFNIIGILDLEQVYPQMQSPTEILGSENVKKTMTGVLLGYIRK